MLQVCLCTSSVIYWMKITLHHLLCSPSTLPIQWNMLALTAMGPCYQYHMEELLMPSMSTTSQTRSAKISTVKLLCVPISIDIWVVLKTYLDLLTLSVQQYFTPNIHNETITSSPLIYTFHIMLADPGTSRTAGTTGSGFCHGYSLESCSAWLVVCCLFYPQTLLL